MVALQALSMFAERVYGAGLDVAINIVADSEDVIDFHITRENSLLLQQQKLPHPQLPLHITAKGEGCIMLQVRVYPKVLKYWDT